MITDACEKLWHGEKVIWDARLLAAARHCKKFVKEMERPIHYEVTEQDKTRLPIRPSQIWMGLKKISCIGRMESWIRRI